MKFTVDCDGVRQKLAKKSSQYGALLEQFLALPASRSTVVTFKLRSDFPGNSKRKRRNLGRSTQGRKEKHVASSPAVPLCQETAEQHPAPVLSPPLADLAAQYAVGTLGTFKLRSGEAADEGAGD